MSVMDWVFAALIALLGVRCFVRGFVREILSVASFAIGLLAALLFYNSGAIFLAEMVGLRSLSFTVRCIIAFALCFIMGFLITKLVEYLVRSSLEAAHLEMFDRILGLALGIIEGLAVVALVLLILELQTFFDAKSLLEKSFFARTLLPIVGPTVDQTLRPAIQDFGGVKKSLTTTTSTVSRTPARK